MRGPMSVCRNVSYECKTVRVQNGQSYCPSSVHKSRTPGRPDDRISYDLNRCFQLKYCILSLTHTSMCISSHVPSRKRQVVRFTTLLKIGGPQCGTSFVLAFWHLEFGGRNTYYTSEKNLNPCCRRAQRIFFLGGGLTTRIYRCFTTCGHYCTR